jgi:hypothetical protein
VFAIPPVLPVRLPAQGCLVGLVLEGKKFGVWLPGGLPLNFRFSCQPMVEQDEVRIETRYQSAVNSIPRWRTLILVILSVAFDD